PVHIDESHDGRATPVEHAGGLAREKARALAPKRSSGTAIGADTIVVLDGDILGKPSSFDDALGMLKRLQGRWHTVHTGIALHDLATRRGVEAVDSTEVRFRS
ncbi:MAG: hypothetical protein GWN37_10195, partial [Gammaproteobacteria bacterium]|nr:hypothetical protein [Gammaproteobacteria bacterium]